MIALRVDPGPAGDHATQPTTRPPTTAVMPHVDLPAPNPPVVKDTLPRHIAFIADGNRRWASRQGLTVEDGYEAGAAAVHRALAQCRALGVQVASVNRHGN